VLIGPEVLASVPTGRWQAQLIVVSDVAIPAPIWAESVRVGVERVVVVPEGESWLLERLSAEAAPDHRATVITVQGGHGGAGASTLAVGLAVEAARHGARTVLMDADPLSGGLDLPLALEDHPGPRWADLAATRTGRAPSLTQLPSVDGLHVLAQRRLGTSAAATPGDCREAAAGPSLGLALAVLDRFRREAEAVICDVGRSLSVIEETVLTGADLRIVVLQPRLRAVAATDQLLLRTRERFGQPRLVVRGSGRGGLPTRRLAELLGAEVLGELPDEPLIAASLEQGLPLPRKGTRLHLLCRDILALAVAGRGSRR
jgi:secretion/DNA translocation related CpaE-like protein